MGKVEGIYFDRVKDIAEKAIAHKEAGLYPFNQKNVFPDALVPEGIEEKSISHALYLFHSIAVDSLERSELVYVRFGRLAKSLKGDMTKIIDFSEAELGEMAGMKNKNINDYFGTIRRNAEKLAREYQGDPGKLLVAGDIEATRKKITGFEQFRTKADLLIKNMVRSKFWNFKKSEVPVKVDRHLIRISLGCGTVDTFRYARTPYPGNKRYAEKLLGTISKLERMSLIGEEDFEKGRLRIIEAKKLLGPLREAFLQVTRENSISGIDLDDTLWLIGSVLCNKNSFYTCNMACPLDCQTRPPSDDYGSWYFLDIDKRKGNSNQVFLF